jgi:hypothetical protein
MAELNTRAIKESNSINTKNRAIKKLTRNRLENLNLSIIGFLILYS